MPQSGLHITPSSTRALGDDVDSIPSFATKLKWAIVVSAYCTAGYEAASWITSRRHDVGTFALGWERHIPFVPITIIPYLSLDPLFFFAFFFCASQLELHALGKRLLLAASIACCCFFLFPLRMSLTRPEHIGFFSPLFRFQDAVDRPVNLCPSLHIAEVMLIGIVYLRRLTKSVRPLAAIWFVLIGLSTVLTYQHQIADIIGGLLLAWFCVRAFCDEPSRS